MKRAGRLIPLAALPLALGITACASGQNTETPTTPSASPTPPAECPVGTWQSTQVASGGAAGAASVTAQGGSGVRLTVAPDGAVTVDFSAMQPVVYTASLAGAQLKGEYQYAGTMSGAVTLPGAMPSGAATPTPGTVSPAPATPGATPTTGAMPTTPAGGPGTSGPWQPAGTVNIDALKITVRVTEPVAATVVDNVAIGQVTGAQRTQAGNAIDLQPLLRAGQYTCSGDTLTVVPSESGPTVTWTLQRA
jgi:hypothetical protein